MIDAATRPTADGSPLDLSRGADPRWRWAPPTADLTAVVDRYLAGKGPRYLAELEQLVATTEGYTMSEVDLIAAVAAAYVTDRQPERAALVLEGHYATVGPRTLRSPSGCLVTWMACGCVMAHRRHRIGRRIAICSSGVHEGRAGELARDSGGLYQESAAA